MIHGSKLGAQTWLFVLFLIVSNPKGRSSVPSAADLGITQKSAWHLAHRIRRAFADGGLAGFEAPVEADETLIGGRAQTERTPTDPHKPPSPNVPIAGPRAHRRRLASAKNMRARRRRQVIHVRGGHTKAPVFDAKDRASGRTAAMPADYPQTHTLSWSVGAVANRSVEVFTDGNLAYTPLSGMGFRHERVAHTVGEYVRWPISTNGIENYWSLLERT